MSNPVWINYKEKCYGASDPTGAADTYNRPNRTIWDNFKADHDKDGDHKSDLISSLGMAKHETGTYTGTGTAQTITLATETTMDVKYVRVWGEESAYTWISTETPYNLSISAQGVSADEHIVSLGTGGFEVGTSDDVNKSGATFYFSCWGV